MQISESNWQSEEIYNHYNKLRYIGKHLYIKRFDAFFTTKQILNFILNNKGTLLDVGIGHANFYRYLELKKVRSDYTGADINPFFLSTFSFR